MAEDLARAKEPTQASTEVSNAPVETTPTPTAAQLEGPVSSPTNPVATRQPGGELTSQPITGEILPPRKRSLKRFVLPLIAVAALGIGGHYAYNYFTEGQFIMSTDDAYVKADTSIIAAKISGYIEAVPVSDNAHVAAGDDLVRIDDGDYRLAVQSAKDKIATQDATIARLGRQAEAQVANIAQAEAQIAAAQADAVRAALAFERTNTLAKSSFATQAALDQTRADKDRTAAAVASARAALASAKASLDVFKAEQAEAQKTRGELETALARAERDLTFAVIKAPFEGIVGNRAAQPGQYVTAGTRLLALVPMQSAYVEANFKETQLAHMAPGQKAEITVDAYSGRKIEGTVESFAPASGSQFSLLPPENATGNFTKIVQRVPVRIRLPADVTREGILRPGLSVVVGVHTRDENQPKPTLMGALGLERLDLSWLGFGAKAAARTVPDGSMEAQR